MIERRIIDSVSKVERDPAHVARDFKRQVAAGEIALKVVGTAADDPERLFRLGYAPRYEIDLFGWRFLMAEPRQNEDIRFFVTYAVKGRRAWARLFYKDVSLIWRSASHTVRTEDEAWIGKGDLVMTEVDGEAQPFSNEATTDLPFEMQWAIESLVPRGKKVRTDWQGPGLVLRNGGPRRIAPFSDFTMPRRRAQADPANLVNGGRSVARFTRKNDPSSLVFVRGYAPDFEGGVIERSQSRSKVYGGRLRRFRVLSENRRIQYYFFGGPRMCWLAPPQALTTQLSSFGLRTIDVVADDDLSVPGWEYHYLDDSEDPPVWVSQIPKGYAGRPNADEPTRADASPWLNALPVIQEFKRKLLGRKP